MVGKNKILALIFGALIISTTGNAFAYTPIGQDYHEVATRAEHEDAEQAWKEEIQNHNGDMVRSSFLENKIQAPLIKYNPDKLKKANSPSDDGLYNVYIADTKNPREENQGRDILNYIYITQGHINRHLKEDKDYNVYGYSVIACTYAHEAGHWYYNDLYKRNQPKSDNEIQKAKERRADKFALQTVDNVPQFSVGGDLINYSTNWNLISQDHPSNQERWTTTYNYIKNNGNGRVRFKNNEHKTNNLIISTGGYDFEVAPPVQLNPETILNEQKTPLTSNWERASYVAGTVAWAIKNNAWNTNSITYEDAHQYFNDLPANVKATAIIATKGSKYKIIDWYLDPEYLNDNQKEALNDYLICLNASIEGSDFLKAVNK